jgi:hypothetical protein
MVDFIVPLIPWLAFSFIMVLADWRFSLELWKLNKKRDKADKPKPMKYGNKIVNCIMIVLLAGCMRVSAKIAVGIDVIATTGLIAWAAIEFTRVLNKYMEIEGVDKQFNIFKLFRRAHIDDVLEDKPKDESKGDEDVAQ